MPDINAFVPISLRLPTNGKISTIPPQSSTQGVADSLDISPYLTDGFPSGWTLSLHSSAPSWVSLSGTTISWTPPIVNPNAENTYSILLVYSHPTDSSVFECGYLRVHVPARNQAPVWNEIPEHSGLPGVAFSLNLNNFVTGIPTPSITRVSGTLGTYTLSNGILSGTRPTGISNLGTQTFTFRATNVLGNPVSGNVNIATIAPPINIARSTGELILDLGQQSPGGARLSSPFNEFLFDIEATVIDVSLSVDAGTITNIAYVSDTTDAGWEVFQIDSSFSFNSQTGRIHAEFIYRSVSPLPTTAGVYSAYRTFRVTNSYNVTRDINIGVSYEIANE